MTTPPLFIKPHYSLIHFTVIIFFFNDTATTEIYTLSLHDALPIFKSSPRANPANAPTTLTPLTWVAAMATPTVAIPRVRDRKSTRLNSSHITISYAVFCLKKKKNYKQIRLPCNRMNTLLQTNKLQR